MKWLFGKTDSNSPQKQRTASVDSIRQKLAGYQSTAGRSVFVGPSTAQWGDSFDYEKVAIDPDSSGFHHVPFHC
ncbi:MAG: hypothetical protein VYA55_07370 [Pseudomonadota bacterium]|nr:hypothetical protein [Pseudomonadota bacterium]